MRRTLEKLVREALRNAADNGHTFDALQDREIAADMKDCDADIAPYHIDDVIKVIARLRGK